MQSRDLPERTTYSVFLLRLWRDNHRRLHASLQAAGSTAPYRFADLEALIAFLRELATTGSLAIGVEPAASPPLGAPAPATPAAAEPGTQDKAQP